MPTTAERRALWFLAGALTLGAGVRAAQAHRADRPAPPSAVVALDAQLAAVDSARLRQGHRNRAPRAPAAGQLPVAGALPGGRAFAGPGSAAGGGAVGAMLPAERHRAPPPALSGTVDADRASAVELEALPGVGPQLAARIVADRDRNGPFGSIAGLERVKGIGPALAARLASRVRFSGVAREVPSGASASRRARGRSKRVSGHGLQSENMLDSTLSRREL